MAAVNADGQHGRWTYRIIHKVTDLQAAVASAVEDLDPDGSARPAIRPTIAASPRLPRE